VAAGLINDEAVANTLVTPLTAASGTTSVGVSYTASITVAPVTTATGVRTASATAALAVSPATSATGSPIADTATAATTTTPLAQASGTVSKSSSAQVSVQPISAASALRLIEVSADLVATIETLSSGSREAFSIAEAYVDCYTSALAVCQILAECGLLVEPVPFARSDGISTLYATADLMIALAAQAMAGRRSKERWGTLRI
jgi:hypothetical protein